MQHFLERRICEHEHIYWAIRASRRVTDLRDTLELSEQLICETLGEGAVKPAQVSLIGLWGKPYTKEWRVERTCVTEDMDRVDMAGVDDANVPPTLKACTVVLNNYSYMPLALVVWMDKMRHVLWTDFNDRFEVVGCITDDFFLDGKLNLCKECASVHPGGLRLPPELPPVPAPRGPTAGGARAAPQAALPQGALFKLTEDIPQKVPTCAQRFEDVDCLEHEPEPMEWVTVAETDTETLHKLLPDAIRPAAVMALRHAGTILDMINE